ncbi:hypothetical protein OAO94_06535 [Flavobacteriaceae bacterium]|nr:hypothetical protein [Flavobacteriaceae bacterium]
MKKSKKSLLSIFLNGIELSEEYIEYHRNNIFGYFLEGKQIRSLKTAK